MEEKILKIERQERDGEKAVWRKVGRKDNLKDKIGGKGGQFVGNV